MFKLENLVRENIKRLAPYSSARTEFSGAAQIFLDANENSFGSPLEENYSRYPDPLQIEIKKIIARRNNVGEGEIFVGSGSDEAIDLLFRIFCRPKEDNVLIFPPTYGMYQVSAEINDTAIRRVNLTNEFQFDFPAIKKAIDAQTKMLFVCSPNNPTGNSMTGVLDLLREFDGIVVVDEAYIHFSRENSLISEIANFPNLVVLQTFSKAWGLAGLRVGLAFANEEIIKLFNKVKPPYNVSEITQKAMLKALANESDVEKMIDGIISEREKLSENLEKIAFVKKIYPSDANFLLIETTDANSIYHSLLEKKIVVRNRTNVELCKGCLRITVGTKEENEILIEALRNL